MWLWMWMWMWMGGDRDSDGDGRGGAIGWRNGTDAAVDGQMVSSAYGEQS